MSVDQSHRLDINDLMYNIETKLSQLSQIQHNNEHENRLVQEQIKKVHDESQKEQFTETNSIMDKLNKKMLSIINEKSPQRHNTQTHNKTQDKNRMHLTELQTATRNIDQIKHNRHVSTTAKLATDQIYNIKQFKDINSDAQMSESIMTSSKSSSKILSKFNSIELNYIEKIKTLSFKVSFLEQRLQQVEEEKQDIMGSLETYKALYVRKQEEIDRQLESQLYEIKEKLVESFAEECRLKYTDYITQLKESTSLLNQERKKRKFFEDQNKILKLQKENYDHMYKSLLKKQKESLKIDIHQTRNELNTQIEHSYREQAIHTKYNQDKTQDVQYSQIENNNFSHSELFDKENVVFNTRGNYLLQKKDNNFMGVRKQSKSKSKSKHKSVNKDKSISLNKKNKESHSKQPNAISSTQKQLLKNSAIKKSKKNSKTSDHINILQNQMSKQQLIPFLAKGIQQLKQRLQMK